MLKKFWRRSDHPAPSAPSDRIIYAIGDIHGRADLLKRLHENIEQDARTRDPAKVRTLVYLGDYIDRGPFIRDVLSLLIEQPLKGFEVHHLKGNHEAMMLEFLEDATTGLEWKDNGGLETLRSYNASQDSIDRDPMAYDAARDLLDQNLPASHKAFLNGLSSSISFGDYFFAHAGVRPGVSLGEQVEQDLLWIRSQFLNSDEYFGKVVVHGHTPDKNVEFKPNQIGIDTGAFMTNILTCLVLDGETQTLIQTD